MAMLNDGWCFKILSVIYVTKTVNFPKIELSGSSFVICLLYILDNKMLKLLEQ